MNTNTIDGRTQSAEIDATVTCQPHTGIAGLDEACRE